MKAKVICTENRCVVASYEKSFEITQINGWHDRFADNLLISTETIRDAVADGKIKEDEVHLYEVEIDYY